MRALKLILVILFAGLWPAFSSGVLERPVKLAGNVIPHPAPAPDFTLTDQN